MKSSGKVEDRGVIAALLILCLALIVLTTLLLANGRRMTGLLLEYDVSRVASIMLEEYVQSETLFEPTLFDRILGAGIYDENGHLIRGSGDVPDRVTETIDSDSRFVYIRGRREVMLVRPVRIVPPMPERMRGQSERMRPLAGRRLSFVVRADARPYFRQQAWYLAGMVVSPIVIAILISLLALSYLRVRSFQQSTAERERLAQLGETARTLAHEIKNPLNAIVLRTRVLSRSVTDDARADVAAIDHEVGRLKRLTDRIGDFLRNPVGNPIRVDLAEAVKACIERNGWEVRIECDTNAPYLVQVDQLRIDSVLENVISNAIEASAELPDATTPIVRMRHDRGTIVFESIDYGPGISEDAVTRAFDPFFTSKPSGSGIGLSITKQFVEAAGGTIEIMPRNDAAKGTGTTATTMGKTGTTVRIALPEAP